MTVTKPFKKVCKSGCFPMEMNKLKGPVNIQSFNFQNNEFFVFELITDGMNGNKSGRFRVEKIVFDCFCAFKLKFYFKIFQSYFIFIQSF